ncbi:MAG: hypothetical protein J6P61_02385 [Erysipelotrichaceae bacterium]|nr:hypothetical protein [Erysipelotrichaceae bacterium]
MKRLLKVVMALMMCLSLAACSNNKGADASKTETSVADAALCPLHIDTEGLGQIAYAEEGKTPEFDDEYPAQSAMVKVAEGSKYVLAAKADEGFKFKKWTLDGKDYSTEDTITVEVTAEMKFVAVFE